MYHDHAYGGFRDGIPFLWLMFVIIFLSFECIMIMLMMVSEMAFHTCDEIQAFKEAFDAFDWNKSGTISYKSLQVRYSDIV